MHPEILKDLPPPEGEEGLKTLEGIDSNHDGVRDNVERYIKITFNGDNDLQKSHYAEFKAFVYPPQPRKPRHLWRG